MNTFCFNLELRMKQNDCTSIWFFHSKIVNNSNTFKVIFIFLLNLMWIYYNWLLILVSSTLILVGSGKREMSQ